MTFATTLNNYCDTLNCSNKELAERCNVSASAVSRYRKSERTPDINGRSIRQLAQGIAEMFAEKRPDTPISVEAIQQQLANSILEEQQQGKQLCENTDSLMTLLGIRNSEMANALHIDPSYLSRIRSKQRIPADQVKFARNCARFASKRCYELNREIEVAQHIGLDPSLLTKAKLTRELSRWLLSL